MRGELEVVYRRSYPRLKAEIIMEACIVKNWIIL